ncbi:MAG TPA: hypothetical protein VGE50_03215 [Gammaproteobacteria bacterium]
MKKPTLLSALAIAAVAAASLSLPATASAARLSHEEATVLRGDQPRETYARPVHYIEHRYSDAPAHGHPRWAQSRYQHDRGYHHGHHHRHAQRYEYRPVVRYEPRYEYRSVERYEPRVVERYDSRPSDDIRVRISYDLHL